MSDTQLNIMLETLKVVIDNNLKETKRLEKERDILGQFELMDIPNVINSLTRIQNYCIEDKGAAWTALYICYREDKIKGAITVRERLLELTKRYHLTVSNDASSDVYTLLSTICTVLSVSIEHAALAYNRWIDSLGCSRL